MRYYLVQLIGACQYMHGENVIHRDLKLGNIFLDSRMDIKVGDFGLAALIEKEGERKKYVLSIAAFSGRSESSETDSPVFLLACFTGLSAEPPTTLLPRFSSIQPTDTALKWTSGLSA